VVMRRSVVEMARTVGCNTVVDGRASDPDRDRQRACARSPGAATQEWRTRTTIFVADPVGTLLGRCGPAKPMILPRPCV